MYGRSLFIIIFFFVVSLLSIQNENVDCVPVVVVCWMSERDKSNSSGSVLDVRHYDITEFKRL